MAYTNTNFKTKKALKEAVARWLHYQLHYQENRNGYRDSEPTPVRCHQPGLGPDLTHYTGNIVLEGPHYPAPHRWYASATLQDGIVIKVK